MIKKSTTATFKGGEYQGIYDWQGGIPLTVGETITVIHNSKRLTYLLFDKKTILEDLGEDQNVRTEYFLSVVPE